MVEERKEKNLIEVFKGKFVKIVYKDGNYDAVVRGIITDFDINFIYINVEGKEKMINTAFIVSITHNKGENQ